MGSLIFNFSLKVNLSSSGTLNLGPEPQHRTLHSCVHKPEWRKSVIEKSVEKLRFIKSKFWSWCSLRWQRHIGSILEWCTLHINIVKVANQLFLESYSVCRNTWRRAQGMGGWSPAEGPPRLQPPLLPLLQITKSKMMWHDVTWCHWHQNSPDLIRLVGNGYQTTYRARSAMKDQTRLVW